MLPQLTERDLQPESMDVPNLPMEEHGRALAGLARLNNASLVSWRIWRQILQSIDVRQAKRLKILDVACGGGDVALGLWKIGKRCGLEMEISGVDLSANACAYSNERFRNAGASIDVQCLDAVHDPLPGGYDVVMSSLFLHHLRWKEAVTVLRKMAIAGQLLIVSDLRRSTIGYAIAQLACRLVTRSTIVHFDGPQSVANAFTLAEVAVMCQEAGLADASIQNIWPWRLMITWSRESG